MIAQKTQNVTLWIAADKVPQLFGSVSNNTITYESGASIWVPAQPEQHMLRGMKYTATGSPQQLQQLAAKLLNQAAPSAALTADQDAKEWWYLNDEDVQFGPFSGKQLSKYNSSGVWTPDFLICHGTAGIWLPIWLVLRLLGLHSQLKRSLPASVPAAGQSSVKSSTAGAGREAAASALGAAECDDDYGASNAACTAQDRVLFPTTTRLHQQQQQQYSGAATGASDVPCEQTQSRSNTLDSFAAAAAAGSGASPPAAASGQPDSTMLTVQEPSLESDPQGVLAEVARLRQDSAYLEELNRAVDMDWEPLQQQQQQQGQWGAEQSAGVVKAPGSHAMPDSANFSATQLAVASIPAAADIAASMLQQQQQQHQQLMLVVDTNVLLDERGLQLLQQLQDMQRRGLCGGVQLVVVLAWTVLVELDKLKTRSVPVCLGVSVAAQARAAVRYLQEAMAPSSSTRHMFKAQSVQEFRVAAREFDFGVADNSLVADDRILQCVLHFKQQQQQQCVGGVLLLTSDRVLRLKAQANAVAAASLKELPIASAEKPQQQQQSLLTSLMQLAQPGTDFNSRSDKQSHSSVCSKQQQQQVPAEVSVRSTAGGTVGGSSISRYAAAAAAAATAVQSTAAAAAGGSVAERPYATVAASALHCITQLRLGLSDRVVEIFRQEFDNLWLDVVSAKPPWRDVDFLYVLKKHWRSCLQEHCTPSARHNSKQLEAAVQYLIDTHKQLQKHNYSQLQMPQVKQNVAVRVMQLLEAFGAAAVAAEVAAAAGLGSSPTAAAAAAGGLSGTGRGLSDRSNAGVRLHSSGSLGNAAGSTQPQGLHNQSVERRGIITGSTSPGSHTGARSAVERVAETGAGLGSNLTGQQDWEPVLQRVKKHAVRHTTHHQQQPQEAAELQCDESWQLLQGCKQASSKRQRGATGHASDAAQQQQLLGSSSSVRQLDMQHVQLAVQLQQDYYNHNQQRQQQLVSSSSVGQQVLPDMQHVQHTHLANQLQQDYQQQQQQQQQCGQQSLHADNTQQRQQRYPGTAAMLAAAAAGIPAPALHGPCLRMQQLLQYLLAVLEAVMQPFHQALQYAPAADEVAQMTTAVGQKIQHIVQMLDWILTQLHQLYQQQQPGDVLEAAAASNVGLQENVLQAGLSLVELCALLMNQPQAGCAVAAQLSANAVQFVQDALAYLLQGCSVSTGQGQGFELCFQLQQLSAAEQQLGWLAAQAAELSARGNGL